MDPKTKEMGSKYDDDDDGLHIRLQQRLEELSRLFNCNNNIQQRKFFRVAKKKLISAPAQTAKLFVGLEQTSGSFLKRLSIDPTLLETAKKKEVFDDTGTTQTKASANAKKQGGEKHQRQQQHEERFRTKRWRAKTCKPKGVAD